MYPPRAAFFVMAKAGGIQAKPARASPSPPSSLAHHKDGTGGSGRGQAGGDAGAADVSWSEPAGAAAAGGGVNFM